MRRPTNAVVLPDIPLTGSTTVTSKRRGSWRRDLASARAKRDEGATALEFAIVLPVVLAVVFFALYGAMYFFYGAIADHVARTVVRQVSIPISGNTDYPDLHSGMVLADAKAAAGTLIPNPTTVTTSSLPSIGAPAEGDFVTVTVTYKLPVLDQLASMIPGMSSIDTITRSASERRQ